MAEIIDMMDKRFGLLVVLGKSYSKNGVYWRCLCDCGKITIVRGTSLRNGTAKSCGCGSIKQALLNCEKHRTKHGFSHKERLYETWKNMKRRCYDKNNKRYQFYGGKNVCVCKEWLKDYLCFRNWALLNGYSDKLTLDRIDNNGNYCPENCRWATAKQQANNQSRNHFITYKNITLTLSEWASKFGITYATMQHRIQRNWDMDKIENTPRRISKR